MSQQYIKPVKLPSKLAILTFIILSCIFPAFIFDDIGLDATPINVVIGYLIFTGITIALCITLWYIIIKVVLTSDNIRGFVLTLIIILVFLFCIGLLAALLPCSGEGCMGNILFLFLITLPCIFFIFHAALALTVAYLYKKGILDSIGGAISVVSVLIIALMSNVIFNARCGLDCLGAKVTHGEEYSSALDSCNRITESYRKDSCRKDITAKFLTKDAKPFVMGRAKECLAMPLTVTIFGQTEKKKETCYDDLLKAPEYAHYVEKRPHADPFFLMYAYSNVCELSGQIPDKAVDLALHNCITKSFEAVDAPSYLDYCSKLDARHKGKCYTLLLQQEGVSTSNPFVTAKLKDKCESQTGIKLQEIYTDEQKERRFSNCLKQDLSSNTAKQPK